MEITIMDSSQGYAAPICNVEYVGIDDIGIIRNKTLFFTGKLSSIRDLPWEQYWQRLSARPVAIYHGITENEKDFIVLCEIFDVTKRSTKGLMGKRESYRKIVLSDVAVKADVYFEIEQEFVFKQCVDMKNFSMGKAREATEAFCKACCNACIPVYSINYKSADDECWSYRVGPFPADKAGDILWITRYIMKHVSEQVGLTITFDALYTTPFEDRRVEKMRPMTRYRFSDKDMRDVERKNRKHIMGGYATKLCHESTNVAKLLACYGNHCKNVLSDIRLHHPNGQEAYIEDCRPCGSSNPYDVIKYIMKACFSDNFELI